jgi:hypothetical protein
VSCGAALYHARLALRMQGFDPYVELLPDGSDAALARIRATPGQPSTAEESALAEAAGHRHMQRGQFEDRSISESVVASLRDAVSSEGAWLRVLTSTDDQIRLAVVLSHADEAEITDEQYQAEVAEWTSKAEGSGEGLPASALPAGLGSRHSSFRLRTFGASEADQPEGTSAEHPLPVIIGTRYDAAVDWLVAGQAMARLLIRASVDGVQASPLGQAIDLEWARQRLANELGLVGHPQMVLRLGYAAPGPETPRRPTEDLMS